MSGIPWESEERQNYIRADYIVSDVVRKELRRFFIQEWNKLYQASLGAWDDTNTIGQELFNKEISRPRPNKTKIQSQFQNGNTNEWDCSVLFDAILYSNSISASLNPTQKTAVDCLRKLRNEITHKPEKTLDDADFETKTTNVINALKALRLSSNEVVRIKNLYKSFQILPPKPTHEVVSRSDRIHGIREDLEKLRCDNDGKLTYFYISGNPGSGKSQLARQVCEDICKDIHVIDEAMFVMTLNGKDLESLLYSYEDFCRRLNCNESVLQNRLSSSKAKDEKIKDLRSQISYRIKNWKKWWIIVDNVENLELISPLLPMMGGNVWNNGQIIVTTQNTNAIPSDSLSSKHISLSLGMNDQECRKLLALLSKTGVDDSLLDEVAAKLDRQPLAMAAAAAYMRQVIDSCPDFSWRDYLEKLEKGKIELTEERLRQTNSAAYSSTMSAAVLLAVTNCAGKSKIFEHAFNLFSLISFEPLPLDLVVKYIQQQEEELDAEDIILAIKHCSLFVHVGNKESDIRLHRVVHEAVKIFCLPKEPEIDSSSESEVPRKRKKTIHNHFEAVARKVLETLYYFEGRKDKIKLISHLKAFNAEINKLFPNDGLNIASLNLKTISVYEFFGRILIDFSEFKLSEEFLQQALKIALEQFGENDINLFDCYNYLGVVFHQKGDQKQSLDYLQKALKIASEDLGSNQIKVAVSYNNLGCVFYDKGDFEQAGDFHHRALEIRLQQSPPNHVDVADSYNNLRNVCCKKGDLEQALDYYQQSLKIRLEQLGENHIDVARSYNNRGIVCHDKGDLEQASDSHQRTLEIRLEQLGPDHVNVARSYNNLGNVCLDKGDLEQASDYYHRGLEILLQQFGRSHVEVAGVYLNLGGLYADKGDLKQAEEYIQQALKIQLQKLGPNHNDVSKSYDNLGDVYHGKGDLKQAEEYYQQALKIQLENFGQNHFDVAKSYSSLGDVYCNKHDLEKSGEYYQRALKIQLEQLGPDHIDVATTYNDLGMMWSIKGDEEKAIEYYQRALKIQLEQLGPDHIDVSTTYNDLGMMWSIKGDEEKAIEYYQLALKIRLEKLGGDHADVAATYRNLGDVYIDLDDEKKAEEYYQQALKIQLEQLEPDYIAVATSYYDLGMMWNIKGDKEKAIECYQQALDIQLEQLGPDHIDVAATYNRLGMMWNIKGDEEKAIEYYQLALKIRLEKLGGNHAVVAATYRKLGDLYIELGDKEKAEEYYQRALKIQLEQLGPDHIDVATTYNCLGMMWNITGDKEKAIEYYQLALKIRLEKLGGNHAVVAATYRNLGDVYIDLDDEDKAEEYYQRADLIDKGDKEESPPRVPGEIVTLTGSKDEWFKETILDENYDMKADYVNKLRNERFSWLKDFSIGINKENKSWQMCITYARKTKPCMQDLKNVFGDNIAPFVKFTEESDDEDEYLHGPSSGDTLYLRNNKEKRGTLTILADQTSNPRNCYAVTCYHVCYCHNKLPNDITEKHEKLRNDCLNGATGCKKTKCYCIHGGELGEFECGLYDDSNDIALIKLTPGLTLDHAIALLRNGVRSELLSKQEVGNIFKRRMIEDGEFPTVKKYGAVTGETEGKLHSITAMKLSDGRNLGFYEIQGTGGDVFAEKGDSGSLVCIIDKDKKLPFAMVCNRTGQVFYCSNLRYSIEALIKKHEMMNIQPCLNTNDLA